MRSNMFLVFVTASLLVSPACSRKKTELAKQQDAESQKDHIALQGEWDVVSSESNGELPPPGLLDGGKFTFSGNDATVLGKKGTFELDATKSPRQIEFLRGNARQIGIYKLTGDHLKLCVGPPDDRPTAFITKPRTDHSFFLLKKK